MEIRENEAPASTAPAAPAAPEPEKAKGRRVGTITFGAVLVLTGALMLVSMFFPAFDLSWVLKLCPLILISLGLEVLWATRSGSKVRYDWVGMILCSLVVTVALGLFGAAWYVLNGPGEWGNSFNGNRAGTETSLELTYDYFNGSEFQLLRLKEGQDLAAQMTTSQGSVTLTVLSGEDVLSETTLWGGDKAIASDSFTIPIPQAGEYEVWVTGNRTRGSVSVAPAE